MTNGGSERGMWQPIYPRPAADTHPQWPPTPLFSSPKKIHHSVPDKRVPISEGWSEGWSLNHLHYLIYAQIIARYISDWAGLMIILPSDLFTWWEELRLKETDKVNLVIRTWIKRDSQSYWQMHNVGIYPHNRHPFYAQPRR